jgi:hypothetical protein
MKHQDRYQPPRSNHPITPGKLTSSALACPGGLATWVSKLARLPFHLADLQL